MIVINSIDFDVDNNAISFDVVLKRSIASSAYLSNCYIKSIKLDTQDSFICANEVSEGAKEVYHSSDSQPHKLEGDDLYVVDHVKLSNIKLDDIMQGIPITLKDDMVFMFIERGGEVSETEPHDDTDTQTRAVGIQLYKNGIYQGLLDNLNQIKCTDCCENTNYKASDYDLMLSGFTKSLAVGDIREAIYYWNKLHSKHSRVNNCNCG